MILFVLAGVYCNSVQYLMMTFSTSWSKSAEFHLHFLLHHFSCCNDVMSLSSSILVARRRRHWFVPSITDLVPTLSQSPVSTLPIHVTNVQAPKLHIYLLLTYLPPSIGVRYSLSHKSYTPTPLLHMITHLPLRYTSTSVYWSPLYIVPAMQANWIHTDIYTCGYNYPTGVICTGMG